MLNVTQVTDVAHKPLVLICNKHLILINYSSQIFKRKCQIKAKQSLIGKSQLEMHSRLLWFNMLSKWNIFCANQRFWFNNYIHVFHPFHSYSVCGTTFSMKNMSRENDSVWLYFKKIFFTSYYNIFNVTVQVVLLILV